MGYYAGEGIISTSPIQGGVEITKEQYRAALDGVGQGREVTIDGGFAIRDRAPSPEHTWQDGLWVEPPPGPDPELEPPTVDNYEKAIQAHIYATARERKYADGFACSTYVNSKTPLWAAEAQAFVDWRDDVWLYAFTEMEKVQQGQREQPTIDEFVAELPAINWPETD